MIQSTVCKSCVGKKCSNKIESNWKDRDGNVHTVEDCAPRRTLLLMQENCNRLMAHQAALEQLRNEVAEIAALRESINNVASQMDLLFAQLDLDAVTIPVCPKVSRDDLRSLPHRGI